MRTDRVSNIIATEVQLLQRTVSHQFDFNFGPGTRLELSLGFLESNNTTPHNNICCSQSQVRSGATRSEPTTIPCHASKTKTKTAIRPQQNRTANRVLDRTYPQPSKLAPASSMPQLDKFSTFNLQDRTRQGKARQCTRIHTTQNAR